MAKGLLSPRSSSSSSSSSGGSSGGSDSDSERITDTGMVVRSSDDSGGGSSSGGGSDSPRVLLSKSEQEATGATYRDQIDNNNQTNTNTPPSEGGNQPRPSNVDYNPNDVSDALAEAKEEALRIQREVQDLMAADNAEDPEGDVVTSSNDARQKERETEEDIQGLQAPDPQTDRLREANQNYMDLLEQQTQRLEEREQRRIESIRSDFAAQQDQLQDTQQSEQAQQRSSLIRSGGYLGNSASAQGVLNNLSKTHQQEVAALEAKRQSKITEAQEAFADNQTEIARAQAQQAIDIEEQIQERQNTFFNQSLAVMQEQRQQQSTELDNESQKLNNAVTRAESIAPVVLDNLDQLEDPQAKEEAIQGYSEKYSIDAEVLRGKIEERRATELANELDRRNTRSSIASRYQSMNNPTVISRNSYEDNTGQQYTDVTYRDPSTGETYTETVQGGTTASISIDEYVGQVINKAERDPESQSAQIIERNNLTDASREEKLQALKNDPDVLSGYREIAETSGGSRDAGETYNRNQLLLAGDKLQNDTGEEYTLSELRNMSEERLRPYVTELEKDAQEQEKTLSDMVDEYRNQRDNEE